MKLERLGVKYRGWLKIQKNGDVLRVTGTDDNDKDDNDNYVNLWVT